MSTEQSESAPQVETQTSPAGDITQQATTPTATTQRVKNPKRVAAGKLVAERTRQAREQQKKAADAYLAEKNEAKSATAAPEPVPTTEGESPKSSGEKNSGLSTTQWLAVGSIVVSLVGIYYKREELKAMAKAAFDKKKRWCPRLSPRVLSQNLLSRHRQEV